MAIGVRNIRALGASLETWGNQASLFRPRPAFWCLDCFSVGDGTDHLEVELRADPHGVGVDQFFANVSATVAATGGNYWIPVFSSSATSSL